MEHTHVNGTGVLQERLAEPETAAALNRLLDRVDAIDRAMATTEMIVEQAPAMFNMMVDTADDVYRQAAEAGVDLDERLRLSLALAEKLTAPKTVAVLSELLDRMDQLEQLIHLADQLPGLLAMFVDIADEFAQRAADAGIDIDATIARGSQAMVKLNDFVTSGALEELLASGVLDPRAVSIVGMLGAAMVKCQDECLRRPEPRRVGLLGALRDLRNPDVQRALAFLVNLGRFFGESIERTHAEATGRVPSRNGTPASTTP
jgi:uncharacterized protein YjgD (DUF1641 family)